MGLSKSVYYYKHVEISEEDDRIMKEIDQEHTLHPTKGVIGMRDHLLLQGYHIGPKKVRRLMRKMAINVIYPKPTLSKLGNVSYKRSYLLKNLSINRKNQVWSTDITYIPMRRGFMYLYAIIDVYSRFIVAWGVYNTLEAENAIEILERAVERYGAPEIINSDQGSQYTCEAWIQACNHYNIAVSMDGRARCLDNVWIERFWKSIKQEYIYLNPVDDGKELRDGVREYIEYYNNKRPHQGIGHKLPISLYSAN